MKQCGQVAMPAGTMTVDNDVDDAADFSVDSSSTTHDAVYRTATVGRHGQLGSSAGSMGCLLYTSDAADE